MIVLRTAAGLRQLRFCCPRNSNPARSFATIDTMKTTLRSAAAAAVICLVIVPALAAVAAPPCIQNDTLTVEFDQASGTFRLLDRASQSAFVTSGRLSATGGVATLTKISDPAFGRGQAIAVSHPDGSRDTIMLFPKLPFALFRASRHNRGRTAILIRQVQTLSATVALGRSAGELTTLGTSGLLAPDKNPGSYAWLAVADPGSRRGVVGGWLTHERGSGIVFSKVESSQVQLAAQIDYGRLRLAPRNPKPWRPSRSAVSRMRGWAWRPGPMPSRGFTDIKLPPQPTGYCTWYSRPYGGASDEKQPGRTNRLRRHATWRRSGFPWCKSTTAGKPAFPPTARSATSPPRPPPDLIPAA